MKLLPASARYLQLILLSLSTAFVISTWLEIKHDNSLQSVTPALQSGADDMSTARHNKVAVLPPISNFASITERPLFMSNRRPESRDDGLTVAAEPASPVSGQVSSGDLVLTGIVLTDDKKIALVQGTDRKTHRLEVGESIDSWSIKAIRNKDIVLTRGNETRDLELQVKNSPPPGSIPQRRRTPPPRTLSTTQTAGKKNTETGAKSQAPERRPVSGTEKADRD